MLIISVGCGRVGYDSQPLDPDGDGGVTGVDAGVPDIQVVAGQHTTCARQDSRVTCWGRAEFGRLGQPGVNLGDDPGEMGNQLAAVNVGDGTVVDVGVGENHTCVLMDTGAVRCWGSAFYGELGTGDRQDRGDRPGDMGANLVDVDLGAGTSAAALEVYENHGCALLTDGRLKCWGRNSYGLLGQEDDDIRGDDPGEMGENLPGVDLGTGLTVTAVAAGDHFNCALLGDSSVKCWGRNNHGQLGQEHRTQLGDDPGELGDNLPPIDLGNGRSVQTLAAGKYHTCALLDNNSVKCWGYNVYGQLGQEHSESIGDGPGEMGNSLPDVDLGPGRSAVAIAAGELHTCALLNNGEVKCWGDNTYGQLGQGDTRDRGDNASEMGDNLAAIELGGAGVAVAIAVGGNQSCAQLQGGTWKCWGHNPFGQLGLGDSDHRGNEAGEMGDNLPPLDFGTGRTARILRMEENHACALLDNDQLKCWGRDHAGQLGYEQNAARGDEPGESLDALPELQLGATPIASLFRGTEHLCALSRGGDAICWGRNDWGQLGQEDDDARGDDAGELADLRAINLGADSVVVGLTSGSRMTCALLDTGAVKCWGYNGNGRLGIGSSGNRGNEPDEMGDALPAVQLGGSAIALASGGLGSACTTCALLADQTVKCWGFNGDGQLGQGHASPIGGDNQDMGKNLAPIDLAGQATAIDVGNSHVCAILTDGAVKCWGESDQGQLGLGDTGDRGTSVNHMGVNLPSVDLGVDLGAEARAVALALGARHSCALLESGAVKCWGRNQYGQLGLGDTTNRGDQPGEMGDALPAIDLGTGRTAVAITAWSDHNCALLDDGAIKCWGANNYGQLGQGDRNHRGDEPGEMGDRLSPIVLSR